MTLLGRQVRLPGQCRCGSDLAVISGGDGKYPALLQCQSCGGPRGQLTEFTYHWIATLAAKFGAPQVITMRSRS
jgi:hypothetical protein